MGLQSSCAILRKPGLNKEGKRRRVLWARHGRLLTPPYLKGVFSEWWLDKVCKRTQFLKGDGNNCIWHNLLWKHLLILSRMYSTALAANIKPLLERQCIGGLVLVWAILKCKQHMAWWEEASNSTSFPSFHWIQEGPTWLRTYSS